MYFFKLYSGKLPINDKHDLDLQLRNSIGALDDFRRGLSRDLYVNLCLASEGDRQLASKVCKDLEQHSYTVLVSLLHHLITLYYIIVGSIHHIRVFIILYSDNYYFTTS